MYMYKPNFIFHYEFVNSDLYLKAGGRKNIFYKFFIPEKRLFTF